MAIPAPNKLMSGWLQIKTLVFGWNAWGSSPGGDNPFQLFRVALHIIILTKQNDCMLQ